MVQERLQPAVHTVPKPECDTVIIIDCLGRLIVCILGRISELIPESHQYRHTATALVAAKRKNDIPGKEGESEALVPY